MAQNEVKQSGRNYNEQEYSLRKNNAYRLDCHANRLARNDGTRLRVANNNCMGICLIIYCPKMKYHPLCGWIIIAF